MEVNKIFLDTNAYSRLLKGDRRLQETLEQASTVYISVIAAGELFTGFKMGKRERQIDDYWMSFCIAILLL